MIHPTSAHSGGQGCCGGGHLSFVVGVVLVPSSLVSPSPVRCLSFGAAFQMAVVLGVINSDVAMVVAGSSCVMGPFGTRFYNLKVS